jgi:hypothetical protein
MSGLCDEHDTSQNCHGEPCWVCLAETNRQLEARVAALEQQVRTFEEREAERQREQWQIEELARSAYRGGQK